MKRKKFTESLCGCCKLNGKFVEKGVRGEVYMIAMPGVLILNIRRIYR